MMASGRSGLSPSLTFLGALFFASGLSALVIETTWLRWFRLLFGATAPAASATLVAFFLGGALGAATAARLLPRVSRPLLLYGVLELMAACWGLAVPVLLTLGVEASTRAYGSLQDAPALLAGARFAIALGATIPTAFCFGATLPAIGAAAISSGRGLGRRGAVLYAVNTLGGAVGVALTSFWLPARVGVWNAYAGALGLSAAIAAVAIAASLARERADGASPAGLPSGPETKARPRGPEPSLRGLLSLSAGSGFGSFCAQILFIQAFGQVLNQSVHAFGAVLSSVLIALAIGGVGSAVLASQQRFARESLTAGALVAASLGLLAFPALLHAATGGLTFLTAESWPGYAASAIGIVAATAGPALLTAALVFPLTFVLAEERLRPRSAAGAGRALGALSAANTLGAIAGAIAAPYLLLPLVGLWNAFGLLSVLYGLAAAAVGMTAWRRSGAARLLLAAATLAWVVVAIAAGPTRYSLTQVDAGATVVDQWSTPSGIVSVVDRPTGRLIRTDNHYSLGGTDEVVHQERQGHLPLLLHGEPLDVAFVGTATGITAGAALAHPIRSIHLVELVPGVAHAAERYFASANRGVHRDPRAVSVVDDARNFFASTHLVFDVVVADLFVPWRAGTSSLFSLEHFENVRDRLSQGGVFAQWLPLYQIEDAAWQTIVATFKEVFPTSAVFRGDFYGRFPIVALIGWRGDPAPASAVSAAAARLGAAGERDRWVTDPGGVWSLYVGPLVASRRGGDPPLLNSDDRPRLEYGEAQRHAARRSEASTLVGTRWIAVADELTRSRQTDAIYPRLTPEARRAMQGGAALQLAGALYVSGRNEDASRALALAAGWLPRHLLAEASADPTAAELWHVAREPE